MSFAFLILFLVSLSSSLGFKEETFGEELLLHPLLNGDIMAHFRFTTIADNQQEDRNYHLFPRALGELIQEFKLQELEVSLTRGVWRENTFGVYAPESAPPGAKVAAWFNNDAEDVDKLWQGLTNALSGQFCASLNFLDSHRTVIPKFTYQPKGVTQGGNVNETQFRVGYLPGENVCTENLSPWKKLLPCGSRRGLSTLLSSNDIHSTKYHSLSLSLRNICSNAKCSTTAVELTQTVTLVFSPEIWPENYGKSVMSWSIRSLFGLGVNSVCPLADSSLILIENSRGLIKYQQKASSEIKKGDQKFDVFETLALVNEGSYNIIANVEKGPTLVSSRSLLPTLQANRYLSGYGQEVGKVVTKISNLDARNSINVVFFDVLPWYTRLFFHTLTITQNGKLVQPETKILIPGEDRVRPYSLELVLRLPANSVTTISIDFEKSILKWLEYPPDANHGFYVGPATITAQLNSRKNFTGVDRKHSDFYSSLIDNNSKDTFHVIRLYTETLLVNLPTPDFSMPYNVICLACTVVALAFGPLHNITTKRLVIEEDGPEKTEPIWKRLMFWRKKKSNVEEEEEKEEEREEQEEEEEVDAKKSN